MQDADRGDVEVDEAIEIADRRRRERLTTRTNGWVFLGDDDHAPAREIIVTNVSRLGVGFTCDTKLDEGMICRLRMGFGPRRLARRIRIQHCTQESNAFAVGGEFV